MDYYSIPHASSLEEVLSPLHSPFTMIENDKNSIQIKTHFTCSSRYKDTNYDADYVKKDFAISRSSISQQITGWLKLNYRLRHYPPLEIGETPPNT